MHAQKGQRRKKKTKSRSNVLKLNNYYEKKNAVSNYYYCIRSAYSFYLFLVGCSQIAYQWSHWNRSTHSVAVVDVVSNTFLFVLVKINSKSESTRACTCLQCALCAHIYTCTQGDWLIWNYTHIKRLFIIGQSNQKKCGMPARIKKGMWALHIKPQ